MFAIVNKRQRIKSKGKKIYQAVNSFLDDEEVSDKEDEDEDDAETEDPFVDNLIAQLDDLRNKVNIHCELELSRVLTGKISGLKQRRDAQRWSLRLDNRSLTKRIHI